MRTCTPARSKCRRRPAACTSRSKPGVHAARGGNETREELATNVDVPGLNSLKIADVALDIVRDERNEPDQVLLVTTSFSVLERELPAKVHAWLLPLQPSGSEAAAAVRSATAARRSRGTSTQSASGSPDARTRSCQLTQIPGEREHYELHSLRYNADPGRYVYVQDRCRPAVVRRLHARRQRSSASSACRSFRAS